MIAEMREALQTGLSEVLGREVEISEPVLLAGGASKEAWSVDAGGERLLVRRAAGGDDPPAHALARGRVRDDRGGVRGRRQGAAAVRLPPGSRGPRGVRDGAARRRHDRPPDRAEGRARGRARACCPCRWRRSSRRSTRSRAARVPFLAEARLERMVDGARRGRRAASRDRARALVAAREPPARARAGRHARRLPHRQPRRARGRARRRPRLGVRASRRSGARHGVRARARVAVRRAGEAARRRRPRRAVPRALQRAHRLRRAAVRARLLGARRQRRLGDRLSHADAAAPDRPGPQRRARDARPARRRGRVRDRATCWSGSAA